MRGSGRGRFDPEGIATFDRIFAAVPQIPILILSTSLDEETAKLAVQRGAQDYFFKDRLDGFMLPKALSSMIDRAANTEALVEEKERAQVTLNSIGDAVISTDVQGRIHASHGGRAAAQGEASGVLL